MHLEFPLEQEAEGGAQEFLFRLKSSGLKDDTLLEAFYDRVIESYRETENYFIILVHGAYDIPRRAKDGMEMFDASEDVYEFILCSICPVKLSKPGLSYKAETNAINERIRDRVVEPPVSGFLFPAFTDRNTDLHSILYYSKNPDELKQEFSQQLFGCDPPLTAASQKETFNTLVADTLLDGCTYETVKSIHESLAQLMEERKDDPEPLTLMREDVKNLLESTGADASALEQFDTEFEQAAGDGQAPLFVSNVVNTRKFEIKTPDINISVKPDRTDLIETRILNGRPYFLIPADDSVEVNGIPVKPAHTEEYN